MNLIQLKYVIEAAECNSISKAAEKLFTSQASCSNAISNLEKELNISIFERTNKGVKLTKKGEAFIAQAKIIVNQTEMLERIGENYVEEISSLNISSHRVLFLSEIIVKLYEDFNNNIKITLKELSRDKVISDIKERKNDIGLIALSNNEETFWKYIIDLNGMYFNEIKKEKLYVFMAENHPLSNNERVTYEELKYYPDISLPERADFTKFNHIPTNEMLIAGGKKSFYINDKDTIIKVIRKSTAFIIGMKLPDTEMPYGIKGISLENDEIYYTVGWIKRKNEILSNEEKALINLL